MHAYVCFYISKRRVNISTPLQRRMKVSLLQVGTLRHERWSSFLGQTTPMIAPAGESQGLCSRPGAGCRASTEGLSSALIWLLFTSVICKAPSPGRAATWLFELLWAAIIWKAWLPLFCYSLKTILSQWWKDIKLSCLVRKGILWGILQSILQQEQQPIGTLLLILCGGPWGIPLEISDF